MVHAGRRTGRTDIEIGDDIRNELKGQLADSTIRMYLPNTFKHMEHASEHKEPLNFGGSNRPPKPVNQPIEIPDRTIVAEMDTQPIQKPSVIKIIFDPAPIDRDRTQVFIIHYDLSTNTIKKYEAVGRRSLGR